MKRTIGAVPLVAGALLVVAAGVAWAATVNCQVGVVPCLGTDEPDKLVGTNQEDYMNGVQDDDRLLGYRRGDIMHGDDPAPGDTNTSTDGNDKLFANKGEDFLVGYGGSDLLRGGGGRDTISAEEGIVGPGRPPTQNPGEDTVVGGDHGDEIHAVDGFKDTIDCGDNEDTVIFDDGLDVVADNCEIRDPR